MGYREKIYQNYMENVLSQSNRTSEDEWEGYFRFYRRNYASLLPVEKDARILDAGCGAGQFLYFLERMGYTNYLGVDGSPSCVDFCRENDRPVEEADLLEYLSVHTGEFDAVVLNDVIEHFTKEEAFELFSNALQSLKVGGHLIVKTPNMGCPLYAARGRYCDITHEIGFTEKSLTSFYQAAGFVNSHVFGPDVYTSHSALANFIGRLSWKLVKILFKAIYRLYGHRERSVLTRVLIGTGEKPNT